MVLGGRVRSVTTESKSSKAVNGQRGEQGGIGASQEDLRPIPSGKIARTTKRSGVGGGGGAGLAEDRKLGNADETVGPGLLIDGTVSKKISRANAGHRQRKAELEGRPQHAIPPVQGLAKDHQKS